MTLCQHTLWPCPVESLPVRRQVVNPATGDALK